MSCGGFYSPQEILLGICVYCRYDARLKVAQEGHGDGGDSGSFLRENRNSDCGPIDSLTTLKSDIFKCPLRKLNDRSSCPAVDRDT